MTAYDRVLREPTSRSAREALAKEWRAAGDPRAQLVEQQLRYQTHRIENTTWTDEAVALVDAIFELVQKHGRAWAGEVAALVTAYDFHRGCVAEVTLPGAAFADVMPKLVALAPIQHVNLTAPVDMRSVATSVALAHVTSLKAVTLRSAFGDAEAAALAGSAYARNLRWIRLTDNAIGEDGVRALAASKNLATCAYLDLGRNPVDPTPQESDEHGRREVARPELAAQLERTYGPRPWLALPTTQVWPPHRDDISTTP